VNRGCIQHGPILAAFLLRHQAPAATYQQRIAKENMTQTAPSRLTAIIPAVISLIIGGSSGFVASRLAAEAPKTPEQQAKAGDLGLAKLYKEVLPAIITVKGEVSRLDDLEARGIGTAFHIGDGYYVTSAHVVAESKALRAITYKGAAQPLTLVGSDRVTDLALLKGSVANSSLLWAKSVPEVGTWVVAIGNPFGLAANSLSLGVVSGLDRLVDGEKGTLIGLVQTDAALNRGNSGGPLLNIASEVIGINTAILSSSGTSAGVGFAMPASTAIRVIAALKAGRKVPHPSLGAIGTADEAKINTVIPNSAAARAGLRAGDLIRGLAGYDITSLQQASDVVAQQAPGSEIEIVIERNKKEQTIKVKL
jgi:serine protease Do